MYGGGIGTIAICGWSQQVRLMILRTRLVVRGWSLRTMRCAGRFTVFTGAAFAIFTLRYSVLADCVSATWTAPPPMIAQPAAQADSFARAIRTDIMRLLSLFRWIREEPPGTFDPSASNKRRVRLTRQRHSPPIHRPDAGKLVNLSLHPKACTETGLSIRPVVKQSDAFGRPISALVVQPSESNSPPCGPAGGVMPRWLQPRSLRQRPRAVRAMRPSWIR